MVSLITIKNLKNMKKIFISIMAAICGVMSVSAESWQSVDKANNDTVTITFGDSILFIDSKRGEEGFAYKYKRVGNKIVYKDLIFDDTYEFTILRKTNRKMRIFMGGAEYDFDLCPNYSFTKSK